MPSWGCMCSDTAKFAPELREPGGGKPRQQRDDDEKDGDECQVPGSKASKHCQQCNHYERINNVPDKRAHGSRPWFDGLQGLVARALRQAVFAATVVLGGTGGVL